MTRLRRAFPALCFVLIHASAPAQTPGTLIVLNKSDHSAGLMALASGETVATLKTGLGPHEVAVSPDGKTAVVTNYGGRGQPGSSLTVLNLPERRVAKTVTLGAYQRPHGIAFLPDGQRLLVTAEAQKALLVVDWRHGRIERAIETGQEVSHMVVYEAQRGRAFVANIRSGSVTAVDVARGERIKIIPTGAGAEGLGLAPDGREVWVSNRAADRISIIDTETLTVVDTLACAAFPIRLKFTPDGRYVLVSNARSGDVAVFDARRRREIRRIDMNVAAVSDKDRRLFSDRFGASPVPVGILIPPSGRTAYVANTNADVVTVLDLERWQIVGRLQTGKEPDGLGYTPLELRAMAGKNREGAR